MNINQKAFSLIELILLVAVAGMIILVMANIPQAVNLIGVSENESTAKQVIAKKLEDVRALGYDNLSNNAPTGVTFTDSRLNTLTAGSGLLIVNDCPVTLCTNGELIKQVTIKITWKETGKTKSYQVDTLVSKGGLR